MQLGYILHSLQPGTPVLGVQFNPDRAKTSRAPTSRASSSATTRRAPSTAPPSSPPSARSRWGGRRHLQRHPDRQAAAA
ncbi:MAG: hypothetical protein R3F43_10930 [bacterium]